ncbi:hypothetical protein NIES3806_33760 [Microcystis aeruginosa NIES-3806]|nr:hypothetical protein NIES3806_33760 [Microcystis aeruginosa NIES-3806]
MAFSNCKITRLELAPATTPKTGTLVILPLISVTLTVKSLAEGSAAKSVPKSTVIKEPAKLALVVEAINAKEVELATEEESLSLLEFLLPSKTFQDQPGLKLKPNPKGPIFTSKPTGKVREIVLSVFPIPQLKAVSTPPFISALRIGTWGI